MCNLYSMTSNQAAIRNLFKVKHDRTGNLPPLTGIFPDYLAPVIRRGSNGEREMDMMRWGLPGPSKFGEKPVTNVRNVASSHWRNWLKHSHRCLVPATAFSEYHDIGKQINWFALDEHRTPFAFAGIWRPWTGVRGTKANPVEGHHLLFSFLTTEANEVVGPVHKAAMPVILTGTDCDLWLEGETTEALTLQRPANANLLRIVARGEKRDPPLIAAQAPAPQLF